MKGMRAVENIHTYIYVVTRTVLPCGATHIVLHPESRTSNVSFFWRSLGLPATTRLVESLRYRRVILTLLRLTCSALVASFLPGYRLPIVRIGYLPKCASVYEKCTLRTAAMCSAGIPVSILDGEPFSFSPPSLLLLPCFLLSDVKPKQKIPQGVH